MTNSRSDAIKTTAWGVAWVLGAILLTFGNAGNPLNDIRLVLSASTAPGRVTSTWESEEYNDDGTDASSHGVEYSFTLPDGREVKSGSTGEGRLRSDWVDLEEPLPAEVEYIPSSPEVNRLKGNGSQSVIEWVLMLGVRGIFLALFAPPGVKLVRGGLAELRTGHTIVSATPERHASTEQRTIQQEEAG